MSTEALPGSLRERQKVRSHAALSGRSEYYSGFLRP